MNKCDKIVQLYPLVLRTRLANATRQALKESRLLAGLALLEKQTILTPVNNNDRKKGR